MLENEVFNRPYVRDTTKTCECTCSVTCNPDIITNADRIRAMSDEELADMFAQFAEENPSDDAGAWLDWLIKPTEEG